MTRFQVGEATDVGQIRSNNQDSKLVADAVSVFAVADGMGGHQGGEVASAIAVETLEAIITEPTTASVVDAVKEANRRIFERASDVAELRGMGTTLVAIALVDQGSDDEEVAWVNVGDSRAYLMRDDELHQLSRDHSLVEDLRRGGQLTEEEAAVHPQRNILTRALGIDTDVEVDHGAVVPLQGDRFLLCSDGLFNEVDRVTLIATLAGIEDPEQAAVELVRLANAGGGRDNITCVVVDVVDDGGRSARAAEAAAAAAAAAPAIEAAADGADAASLTPTVEMPAVAGDANDALPAAAAPPTDPGLGGPPPPPPPPPPPVPPADEAPAAPAPPAVEAPGAEPPAVEAPVAAAPVAAAAPPPGSASGAAPVNGFPTDDDNDARAADDDLPFGRTTEDVFGDIDKAKGRHRAVTALVAIVVLAVLGGAAYAAGSWYANRTFFLGTEGDRVVVYQGQPGGFLVFDPSVAEDFGDDVTLDDLTDDAVEAVEAQREFGSLANARSFVNNNAALGADPDEGATTTTTTTTEPEPTTASTAGGSTTTTTERSPTTTEP